MMTQLKKAVKKVFSLAGLNKTLQIGDQKIHVPYSDSFYVTVGKMDIINNFVVKVLKKLNYPNDERLFIDVGANIGQTLLSIRTYYPSYSYLGFEPNGVCAGYLEKLIGANHFPNTWVVPVALSDFNGNSLFFKNGSTDTCATLLEDLRPELKTEEPLKVPTMRFDDIRHVALERQKVIVKIDVEGYELSVVKGMLNFLRSKNPVIICEVLHCDPKADMEVIGGRARELASLFRENGFHIYNIVHQEDGSVGFKKMQEFTMKYWEDKSIYQCDYLITRDLLA
jgi:FkbM family methyltransferase